jgi:hypothetical protein
MFLFLSAFSPKKLPKIQRYDPRMGMGTDTDAIICFTNSI